MTTKLIAVHGPPTGNLIVYRVERDGTPIGFVERVLGGRGWIFRNDLGAYGSVLTQRAAVASLLCVAGGSR